MHRVFWVPGFLSSRPNWSPYPITRKRVLLPPPFGSGGEKHSLAREGWGTQFWTALWYPMYTLIPLRQCVTFSALTPCLYLFVNCLFVLLGIEIEEHFALEHPNKPDPFYCLACQVRWILNYWHPFYGICYTSGIVNHSMERLDQSHLYPNLEVPGLTWPGPPAWEASTLEKSHPDSLLIAIRNIYVWARDNKNISLIQLILNYPVRRIDTVQTYFRRQ